MFSSHSLIFQSVREELVEEHESDDVLGLESLIDCSDNKAVASVHYARRRSDSECIYTYNFWGANQCFEK